MLVPHITDEIKAIADQMMDAFEGFALDAQWEVVKSLNEAAELIKVEMLARIAHGSTPSEEVARGLGLDNLGG